MLLVLLTTATFVTGNLLFLKMHFFCTWCPSFCYSANSISHIVLIISSVNTHYLQVLYRGGYYVSGNNFLNSSLLTLCTFIYYMTL